LPQSQQASFDDVTWKFGLDWQPKDELLVYANVGTGYKSGGFNRGGTLGVFGPENITAYEMGVKAMMSESLRFNSAIFYYDYEDLQQAQVTPQPDGTIVNETVNAATASIWGLEVELEAVPYQGGRISLVAGYLSAEFDDFQRVENPFTGVVENLSGNTLVFAPEFTMTLGYQPFEFEFAGGVISAAIQLHYEDDSFLDIQNSSFSRRDSFTRTNLNLRFDDANERYFIEAFVKNLEDEDILSAIQSGTAVIGPPSFGGGPSLKGVWEAPRTYGVRAGFNF
jgi:iron complex outermembrane receptor protein